MVPRGGALLLLYRAPKWVVEPTTLESDMNIELDEVVVQDVSDDALELAAGGAQGGPPTQTFCVLCR